VMMVMTMMMMMMMMMMMVMMVMMIMMIMMMNAIVLALVVVVPALAGVPHVSSAGIPTLQTAWTTGSACSMPPAAQASSAARARKLSSA
jgi:hypothetical protein